MGEVQASQVSLPDAQSQLWNLLFSFINSMFLGCAVELGRADIKYSHDPTLANLLDLAASIPIPPNKTSHLRLLMRLLVHSGIFAVKNCDNGEEGFVLIPMSSLIVQGRDESILSSFVSMMLDSSLVSPWHFLGSRARTSLRRSACTTERSFGTRQTSSRTSIGSSIRPWHVTASI